MGNDIRITIFAKNQNQAEKACTAAFARIGKLDSIMSDYRVDSELNKLCAAPAGIPVHVSRELFLVLERAQAVSKASHGAFDVTVGPLVRIWRNARKTAKMPTDLEISKAKKVTGYEKVRLDRRARSVTLAVAGMQLDLGGIAKGYAGDEAVTVLRKNGIKSALVELGGDVVMSDAPPGTKGWVVRVSNAAPGASDYVDKFLSHCAISSSGDTEQSTVIDGLRYSHVVDPRTGRALTNRVQCTVIAKDGLTTDPISTALSVIGAGDNAELFRAFKIREHFIKVLPLTKN